jgi:hypothetical protein
LNTRPSVHSAAISLRPIDFHDDGEVCIPPEGLQVAAGHPRPASLRGFAKRDTFALFSKALLLQTLVCSRNSVLVRLNGPDNRINVALSPPDCPSVEFGESATGPTDHTDRAYRRRPEQSNPADMAIHRRHHSSRSSVGSAGKSGGGASSFLDFCITRG